ncbi:MAG: hypothetical protein COZ32_01445, partial [Nitrospirae bacterium CG_4_10_14_3_um_filter_53_41]
MSLSCRDQQGMVFVEHPDIRRKVFHEEGLDLMIGCLILTQAVPAEDPSGIGIHHENRPPCGVQEDGIGGLRPYSFN